MLRLDRVISFVFELLNEILSTLEIEKLSFNSAKLLIFLCFIIFFLGLALLLLKGYNRYKVNLNNDSFNFQKFLFAFIYSFF